MSKLVLNITCTLRSISKCVNKLYSTIVTKYLFFINDVHYKSFRTKGIPLIVVSRKSKGIYTGSDFAMNNGLKNNSIGCPQKCTLLAGPNSNIRIGDNVGISQAALIAFSDIVIGNNVKIGGGTCIYTTDFHSLDPLLRASKEDKIHCVSKPVTIKDGAFIGAHCIILKGITIGRNSVIGAGSVVTKNVPDNQIWAGNPAKFIRNIL